MGKHDARRDWLLVTLALAALLGGGCLNPRPEELPSSIDPAGGAADTPVATAAPAAPAVENAGSPTGSSDGDREAPPAPGSQSAPPALDDSAPEAPEAPDAGADAASADAADAG